MKAIVQTNPTHQAKFLIQVDAQCSDTLDTSTMSSGLEDAAHYANQAGILTPIGDEETMITGISVSNVSSPVDAVLLMLCDTIAVTPEARKALERAIASLAREFPRERIVLLTDEDRDLIIAGMALTRKSWELSGDGWIADVIANGYDGYANSPDIVLLEAAFCDNSILRHLGTDLDRLGVLRILSRPEVIDIICSAERAQPIVDFDEFSRQVNAAVSPMTGPVGRTALREHRLEALQLHGLILQRMAARLGVEEHPDEVEWEAQAPGAG